MCGLGRFSLRSKSWSIEEERPLRELVSQGLGITEILQVMGKPRLCVKGKVYNLGLSVVVAAGSKHKVAATAAATSPAPVIHEFGILRTNTETGKARLGFSGPKKRETL